MTRKSLKDTTHPLLHRSLMHFLDTEVNRFRSSVHNMHKIVRQFSQFSNSNENENHTKRILETYAFYRYENCSFFLQYIKNYLLYESIFFMSKASVCLSIILIISLESVLKDLVNLTLDIQKENRYTRIVLHCMVQFSFDLKRVILSKEERYGL